MGRSRLFAFLRPALSTTLSTLTVSLFVAMMAVAGYAAGEMDLSFKAGVGRLSGEVRTAVTQPDGKVIIAGIWAGFDDRPQVIIARFNPDGSRDLSFNAA